MNTDELLGRFMLDGNPVSCEPYGNGHINSTFLVQTEKGTRYILQRLSEEAFKDVPALMENISGIAQFLEAKARAEGTPCHVLPPVKTADGMTYIKVTEEEAGDFAPGYYRVTPFAENSICLEKPESDEDFYQCAIAFGTFISELADYPAETLHETIPNFHNTPDRYRKFHLAVDADAFGRLSSVTPELRFLLDREVKAGTLQRLRERGELPVRVTHNDTKLNNVMLDADTRKALCVIDLDTVMPGLVAYDFGDSVRFGASTAAEDEKDLSRVEMSLDLYETYARGFIPACGGLTSAEIESLPMGAWTMTLENGLRFLTDYLEGDHYYHIAFPEHNLDRCRAQLKLVADMERKWDRMTEIIRRFET